MTYYTEKHTDDTNDTNTSETLLVKHPVIAFSNDTKHDSFAVKQFEKAIMSLLQDEGKEIREVIKFYDGAACQYKGKNSFANLSVEPIKTIHNYFETSHGKSPCDGLGAVAKNACFNAVKSGKAVIGDAFAAFEYCRGKLSHTAKIVGKESDRHISKRSIIYVDKHEIIRVETGVKTLPGTRSLHSVRNVGAPYSLQTRNLSCFCKSCFVDDGGQCENSQYVEEWTAVTQQLEKNKTHDGQENRIVSGEKGNLFCS